MHLLDENWNSPTFKKRKTGGSLDRISVHANKDQQGEAKANLTFHGNSIKFQGNGKLLVEADSETPHSMKQSEDNFPS